MQRAGKKAALLVLFFFILIAPATASGKGTKSGADGGIFLSRYQEQYQNAFHILIPKGWKAEGGMIPSGVQWNVVDLVENNIRFRVTSPDGKSFFGWYPRFYFQDPQAIISPAGACCNRKPGRFSTVAGFTPIWMSPNMCSTSYFGSSASMNSKTRASSARS